MHTSLASPRHQPRPLQRQLHPRVALLDLVLVLQLLVEMPHVQIEIPIAVESEHFAPPYHVLTTRPRLPIDTSQPRELDFVDA